MICQRWWPLLAVMSLGCGGGDGLPAELRGNRGASIWAYTELHAKIYDESGSDWYIAVPIDLRDTHTTHEGDGMFAVNSWFRANKLTDRNSTPQRINWQGRIQFLGGEQWRVVELNYAAPPPWQ